MRNRSSREISNRVTNCRHLSEAPFSLSTAREFFSDASKRSKVLLAEDLWPFRLIRARYRQLSPVQPVFWLRLIGVKFHGIGNAEWHFKQHVRHNQPSNVDRSPLVMYLATSRVLLRKCGCSDYGAERDRCLKPELKVGQRCVIDIRERESLRANYRLNGEDISRFAVDKISLTSLPRTLLVLMRARVYRVSICRNSCQSSDYGVKEKVLSRWRVISTGKRHDAFKRQTGKVQSTAMRKSHVLLNSSRKMIRIDKKVQNEEGHWRLDCANLSSLSRVSNRW